MSVLLRELNIGSVQGKGRGSTNSKAQVVDLAMTQRSMQQAVAVDADNLPGAAAALFDDGFFARPDMPEHRQLLRGGCPLQLGVLGIAEYRIGERLPVSARPYHFHITAHFTFIAQQQGDVIAAMAQVKPPLALSGKQRFTVLVVSHLRQRRKQA